VRSLCRPLSWREAQPGLKLKGSLHATKMPLEDSFPEVKPPRVAECLMHSQSRTVIGGERWRRILNASCSTYRFPLSPPRRQQVQKAAPAQSPLAPTLHESQIRSPKVLCRCSYKYDIHVCCPAPVVTAPASALLKILCLNSRRIQYAKFVTVCSH
jgi:hypothetical protein